MTIYQSIYIKNEEISIYIQIEEKHNKKYEVQISNEWNTTSDNYIQENGVNKGNL